MAEFTLPANSVVKQGKVSKAAAGATNIRRFIVYRYDPDSGENPRTDTYEVDLDSCGPMVLDALLKIKDEMDATIVYGVNHKTLQPEHTIISNASCTTNCLIPILDIIDRNLGIESGSITTIHSAMADQPVIDAYNGDLRKTHPTLI